MPPDQWRSTITRDLPLKIFSLKKKILTRILIQQGNTDHAIATFIAAGFIGQIK
ncbi:hypothetical protein A2U01_0062758, partial [Trifolium medium]|nr:hypothetical protein [Trifolium medium]